MVDETDAILFRMSFKLAITDQLVINI